MVAHHKVVALALHPDNQSLVHLLETTVFEKLGSV